MPRRHCAPRRASSSSGWRRGRIAMACCTTPRSSSCRSITGAGCCTTGARRPASRIGSSRPPDRLPPPAPPHRRALGLATDPAPLPAPAKAHGRPCALTGATRCAGGGPRASAKARDRWPTGWSGTAPTATPPIPASSVPGSPTVPTTPTAPCSRTATGSASVSTCCRRPAPTSAWPRSCNPWSPIARRGRACSCTSSPPPRCAGC